MLLSSSTGAATNATPAPGKLVNAMCPKKARSPVCVAFSFSRRAASTNLDNHFCDGFVLASLRVSRAGSKMAASKDWLVSSKAKPPERSEPSKPGSINLQKSVAAELEAKYAAVHV